MITRELKVSIHRDEVLRQIDCYEGSDLYEEVIDEYEEILDEMLSLCEPVFLMEYEKIGPELARYDVPEGTPVLMVLYSIGKGISEYSTNAFARGDYLKGMLADAMADSALFSLEKEYAPILKEACADLQMGISRRLEAPQDIDMTAQKVIFEKTHAHELCGMEISTGYMLNPVKSNAVLYVLTEDKDVFLYQHNCRNCGRYDCKMRNIPDVPVKVSDGKKEFTIMVPERKSILDALMKTDMSFGAVCGGTGKCGKCKIQVTNGYLPITSFDSKCFSAKELNSGMRLACKAYPSEPLQIELNFKGEADFVVVTDYDESESSAKLAANNTSSSQTGSPSAVQTGAVFDGQTFSAANPADSNHADSQTGPYGIAIDIGTTTIAIQLLSLTKREKICTHSTINHQRSFGADVISRIKASTEGKQEELRASIQHDLVDGIQSVVKKAGVLPEQVTEIAISGNTTMGHLLMGYDCKGLGEYPFTPVNIGLIEGTYNSILDDDFLNARIRLVPGISTFVGGDITSGLYTCDVDLDSEYSLLIDLGTNGEIALGNKDKIMATSTAAGPAFEGGNIEWGIGSIEGAISSVTINNGKAGARTIGDKPPVGICGTGVIETVAGLVKEELVDETGCLDDDYFDDGFPLAQTEDGTAIVFTQQDVREIQLAKAAVRAGLETLILRYGIEKSDISHVYLAGGFGFRLDCQKAIEIGMIPEEFADKIETIGNSSLSGAAKCLLTDDGWTRTTNIGSQADEINLSADKDFNNFYMEHMYFEES